VQYPPQPPSFPRAVERARECVCERERDAMHWACVMHIHTHIASLVQIFAMHFATRHLPLCFPLHLLSNNVHNNNSNNALLPPYTTPPFFLSFFLLFFLSIGHPSLARALSLSLSANVLANRHSTSVVCLLPLQYITLDLFFLSLLSSPFLSLHFPFVHSLLMGSSAMLLL
jgi:hypothetical protein